MSEIAKNPKLSLRAKDYIPKAEKSATKVKAVNKVPENPQVARKRERVLTVISNVTSAEYGCTPEVRTALLRQLALDIKKMLAEDE